MFIIVLVHMHCYPTQYAIIWCGNIQIWEAISNRPISCGSHDGPEGHWRIDESGWSECDQHCACQRQELHVLLDRYIVIANWFLNFFYIQFLGEDWLWKSVIACTGSRLSWIAAILSWREWWLVMHRALKRSKSILPCHIPMRTFKEMNVLSYPSQQYVGNYLSAMPSYSKNNCGIPSAISVSRGSVPWWSLYQHFLQPLSCILG